MRPATIPATDESGATVWLVACFFCGRAGCDYPPHHEALEGTMSEKIEPALTPEEWRKGEAYRETSGAETWLHHHARREDRPLVVTSCNLFSGGSTVIESNDRHAVAALALYGQPFGFTREHEKAVRDLIEMLEEFVRERTRRDYNDDEDFDELYPHGLALATGAETRAVDDGVAAAERIAALLPPRGIE